MMPKPYCYAPFVHMHVHDSESRRICCISDEFAIATKDDFNLSERWKSDYYKKYRKLFLTEDLEQNPPAICNRCTENEKAGAYSDRKMFDDLYSSKNLELNIETGTTLGTPIDIDLRASNLCNLKCRMCSPYSSSQLDKEVKQHSKVLSFLRPVGIEEKDSWITDENLNFLLENINHSERIKLLGGEPTIMPEVHSIMDYLIDKNYTDVPLYFTTNLTNNNKSFLDRLKKLKNVRFNYSIDGEGKTVEYIRSPLNWETTVKNMEVYGPLSQYRIINFTLQAYNILNIKEFLYWINEYNEKTEYKVYPRLEVLTKPNWCSYRMIPKDIRDEYLQNLLKDDIINTDITKELGAVEPIIRRCLNDELELPTRALAKNTKRYDIARKQHIKDFIPEVWDIIKEDYNALRL